MSTKQYVPINIEERRGLLWSVKPGAKTYGTIDTETDIYVAQNISNTNEKKDINKLSEIIDI